MTEAVLQGIRETLTELECKIDAAMKGDPRLMDEVEAARYIGMSASFLRKARSDGSIGERTPAPPYKKVGGSVRYDRRDLDLWIEGLPSN